MRPFYQTTTTEHRIHTDKPLHIALASSSCNSPASLAFCVSRFDCRPPTISLHNPIAHGMDIRPSLFASSHDFPASSISTSFLFTHNSPFPIRYPPWLRRLHPHEDLAHTVVVTSCRRGSTQIGHLLPVILRHIHRPSHHRSDTLWIYPH